MWGIMADIDFDSEKYRKPFGGQRFLVSAIKERQNIFVYIENHTATIILYSKFLAVESISQQWAVIKAR